MRLSLLDISDEDTRHHLNKIHFNYNYDSTTLAGTKTYYLQLLYRNGNQKTCHFTFDYASIGGYSYWSYDCTSVNCSAAVVCLNSGTPHAPHFKGGDRLNAVNAVQVVLSYVDYAVGE